MMYEELLTQAERLVRPCVHLVDQGDGLSTAALWGEAPGGVTVPGHLRHRLTVATALLPAWVDEASGISVVTSRGDHQNGGVVPVDFNEAAASYPGTKLFAKPAVSYPPLDAVLLFGDEPVKQWLRELGWEPSWGYNANFPEPDVPDRYERAYQDNCPLYGAGVYAVLGGWHSPWPDDDWRELTAAELLIWTIRDAEPWVEVWRRDGVLQVVERIT